MMQQQMQSMKNCCNMNKIKEFISVSDPNLMMQNPMMQQQMIQQQMMQQQMMQQQMMQQQMMQQQMMQQQMMQQQMMQQQMQNIFNNYNPIIDNIIEKPEINVTFKKVSGISNIIKVKIGTTICELFYEYSTKFYGTADKQLAYLYKGQRISRRDLRSIEEVFNNDDNPIILVIDSQ